jgi:hypothetical protein
MHIEFLNWRSLTFFHVPIGVELCCGEGEHVFDIFVLDATCDILLFLFFEDFSALGLSQFNAGTLKLQGIADVARLFLHLEGYVAHIQIQ